MPPTGCCRAAINRASCRPPAAAWTRLSTIWPARTRSAADLHAAFTSADIDAVWCLQGGFGSWRLLDLLDYELLRRHAKPFIGYSDITALHLAIQRHAGFVTFHGPMLAQDLLNGREEPTESALYAMVGGRMGQGAWIGAPDYALPTTLMPGTATGRLAGGNLALICAMQGSRHEIDTRDAILFIEDVNEAVPRVDRMLSQLAAAGKFESIKGVLAGSFTRSGARDDAQFQYAFHPCCASASARWAFPCWPAGPVATAIRT